MRLLPRLKMPDLVRQLALPGIVVDVGCGDGGQMEALDDAYTPVGIEISAELALRAHGRFERRGGRCISAHSLEGLAPSADAFEAAGPLRPSVGHYMGPRAVGRGVERG